MRNLIPITIVLVLLGSVVQSRGQEGGVVTQEKWAQALVRTLGWEKAGIPRTNATEADYFSLLSGQDRLEVDARAFQRKYGEAPESFYYYLNIPKSGRYFLRAMIYGGPHFWTIDGGASVLTEAKGKWESTEVGNFILSRGNHLIRVTAPKGSSLQSFSMDSSCSTSIEPLESWHPTEPLTYAAKAATVLKTLELEGKLPQESMFPFTQGGSGYALTYTFYAARSTILTFAARFPGVSRGSYKVDGCGKFTSVFSPSAGSDWHEIFTKTFPQGQHTVELLVEMGPPPSAVTFIRRSARPEDYIKALEDLKMEEGGARELVVLQKAKINLQKIQVARGIERVRESFYVPEEPKPEEKLPSEKVAVPYRESISPLLPPPL